jgi:hypothetical protein
MNQDGFDVIESCLLLITIAYNFIRLFKQLIINDKACNRLSTLRYKVLVIPAYIEEHSNKVIVKMALQMNRRAWIRKLWEKYTCFGSTLLLDGSNGQFGIKKQVKLIFAC